MRKANGFRRPCIAAQRRRPVRPLPSSWGSVRGHGVVDGVHMRSEMGKELVVLLVLPVGRVPHPGNGVWVWWCR